MGASSSIIQLTNSTLSSLINPHDIDVGALSPINQIPRSTLSSSINPTDDTRAADSMEQSPSFNIVPLASQATSMSIQAKIDLGYNLL